MVKLELLKSPDGGNLMIRVIGERSNKQIIIPLAVDLSIAIERVCRFEGVGTDTLIAPPKSLLKM